MSPVCSQPRLLFVLVVAEHDVLAVDEDFARRVFGIGRVDAHVEVLGDVAAARTALVEGRGGEADQGGAFGHAVADRQREADAAQERFGLLVHRRAAHDEDRAGAAEGVGEFFADDGVDGRVEQRNLDGDRHGALFEHGQHLLAVDLFEDQRHAADDAGPHGGHRFEQDLGRGNAPQQRHVQAAGDRCQKVECAAEGMGQRQEREHAPARLEIELPRLGVDRPFE